MDSVSPVFSEAEQHFERIVAVEGKEEKTGFIIMPITLQVVGKDGNPEFKDGFGASVRFRFSEEDWMKIIKGADLVVTEILFGGPFTPLNFQLCKPEERPQF
jgi:hypothetical protein